MRKALSISFALIGWFAVIAQYILMLQNRVEPVAETTVRFLSFFTILTNSLVAIYFSFESFAKKNPVDKITGKGTLTATTVYITVVGLVYQLLLRHIWSPEGLQKIVDELLHSVIPVLVIIYWFLFENKQQLQYKQLFRWLWYPLIYLGYVLIRDHFSGFYPYPFINVTELGYGKVLINAAGLTLVFIILSALFIAIGKRTGNGVSS